MAQFYFHFHDGETSTQDEIGLELPCAEQAYLEAVNGARAIWSELLAARVDPRKCSFRIESAQGDELFVLPLSELLDDCRRSKVAAGPARVDMRHALDETHSRATRAKADFQTSLDEVRETLRESSALLDRMRVASGAEAGRDARRPLGLPLRD